jgi:hypothetical protein
VFKPIAFLKNNNENVELPNISFFSGKIRVTTDGTLGILCIQKALFTLTCTKNRHEKKMNKIYFFLRQTGVINYDFQGFSGNFTV